MTKIRLSVEEAAYAASLSRSQVYELIRRGAIPSTKIGRSRGILQRDLEAFLESTRVVVERQEESGWPGQQRDAQTTTVRSIGAARRARNGSPR